MDKVSLTALGRQHLAAAHDAHSGRSGTPCTAVTNTRCDKP